MGLQNLHQDKDTNRKLLNAEIKAPPDAKRALASVRVAMMQGAELKDALKASDPVLQQGKSSISTKSGYNDHAPKKTQPDVASLVMTPRRAQGTQRMKAAGPLGYEPNTLDE